MMKRYTILNKKSPDSLLKDLTRYENPDGEWIRYDDVEKLEELNREMVEVLKKLDFVEVISHDGDWITFCPACESYSNEHNKGCRLQSLLAKAEEDG